MSANELPNAITNIEKYLAAIAGTGSKESLPKPITNVEKYLDYIVNNGGGGTAESVSYDNTSSGLEATNVQDAIDEVAQGSGGGTATSVSYDNTTSGLEAENVQSAIDELAQSSGGDVTKQYVDDHLALKADKAETAEYPISSTTTGINPTITDSANGYVQSITIYGRTDTVEGELRGIGEDGELNVETCGKNLFDINGKHTIDNDDTSHILIVNDSIVFTNNFYVAARYPIYLSPGTYTISCDLSVTTIAYMGISELSLEFHNLTSGHISKTVEISTAGVYTFAFCGEENNSSGEFRNIQLEPGSTATAYEPFVSTSATVTTGIPLYSVGDVKDELDEKKGVVVKRCEKITVDGSEAWGFSGITTDDSASFYCAISPSAPNWTMETMPNMISNNLEVVTGAIRYNGTSTNCISLTSSVNLGIRISGIKEIADIKTYLASNPVTVVYELAEPYEIPLTASEIAQLRGLRTYNSTTNVTITDDPFVDVGYLLNTDNGQAVADVQNELQEQINVIPAWITSIPEMHRNIFRGQSLGSAVTSAQLAAIADGSFDDLYAGDYWTIPVTIGGVTKNINWRIADIDYYLNAGDTPLTAHHLVIVPDIGLYAARMNTTASNTGGYKASEMYTTNLGTAKTAINTAFPDMVLTHRELIPGNPADSPTWADSTAELLSEIMVYGTQIFSPCNGSGQYNSFLTIAKSQLALFRLAPWFGVADDTYWLRDVVGDPSFAAVSAEGNADGWGASNEEGVRPYFLLGDAT